MFQNSYFGKYFEVLNARDCKASTGNREKTLFFKKLINFRGEHVFDEKLKSYVMSIKEATIPADGTLALIHPILVLQGKFSSVEVTVMDNKNIRRRIILGSAHALKSHYVSVPFDSNGWVSVMINLRSFVLPFGTNYLSVEQIYLKNAVIRRIFTVEQEYEQYLNFPHNLQHSILQVAYTLEQITDKEVLQQQPTEQKKQVKEPAIKQHVQESKSIHKENQEPKQEKINTRSKPMIQEELKTEKISEEEKQARKELLKQQKKKLQAQAKLETEVRIQQEQQKLVKQQQLKQIEERCQQFRQKKQSQQQQFTQSQIEETEYTNTELEGLTDIIDCIEMKMEQTILEDREESPPPRVELQNPLGKSIITRKGNQTIVIDRRIQHG